jgi:large subunit ribosomal protein L17
MRHKAHRNRLIQKPDHGRMLQRNLVTSLLLYEEIRTTRKRAVVIRPLVDRLITVAKTKAPQVAIRSINTVVTDKNASRKLIEVLKERYTNRSSGFTSMKPVGARKGDGAELVDLVLMDKEVPKAGDAGLRPAEAKKKAKKPSISQAGTPAPEKS